jgi:cohesin complex subunit SA-1/2
MNPAAALQSVVEDYLESLSQSPAAAQAELINCILRACGCNDVVDGDKAVDYDGVLDALDDITEGLKQACNTFILVRPLAHAACFSLRRTRPYTP